MGLLSDLPPTLFQLIIIIIIISSLLTIIVISSVIINYITEYCERNDRQIYQHRLLDHFNRRLIQRQNTIDSSGASIFGGTIYSTDIEDSDDSDPIP